MCRSEDFVTFPNKQIDREVKSLHVYCTNKDRGCEWQGEVNYIDKHLTKEGGCEYKDVKCTSGCGGVMQQRDLVKHVETECPRRNVNCQYCCLIGEHQFIEGKHKEECAEYPLACPNKCEEAGCIRRKDMDEHRSRCPLEVISCEYKTMGCEMRMTRQTQQDHNKEKMEYHLHLTRHKLDETSSELARTNLKLTETSSSLEKTAFKLDELNSKFDKSLSQLDVTRKELSSTKEELSCLKNQFSDRIHSMEVLLLKNNRKCDQGTDRIPLFPIALAESWSYTLHNNPQLSSNGNQLAPVTFRITGINKKQYTNREWNSDPFYTHANGYRLCLIVAVNGCEEYTGTHCSMFLRLMKGRNDDYLSWPLTAPFYITLLNQINNCKHYTKVIDFSRALYLRGATERVFVGEVAELPVGPRDFISHHLFLKADPLLPVYIT